MRADCMTLCIVQRTYRWRFCRVWTEPILRTTNISIPLSQPPLGRIEPDARARQFGVNPPGGRAVLASLYMRAYVNGVAQLLFLDPPSTPPPATPQHGHLRSLGGREPSPQSRAQLSYGRGIERPHRDPHYRKKHSRNHPRKSDVRACYYHPSSCQGKKGPCSVPLLAPIYQRYDQDETINDGALMELAGYCARTCHVLKDATLGRGADDLSDPSKKAIEDFGRYVDLAPLRCRQ